ncbi:Syntaxin pep12 [Fonsecaea nubica]|uniref:Syntaxin pep12 n=1 Tax=Fonsecaea nubica TaxID=856822 RepID=A0A178DFW5_9EURO|nr:Syntaxin pep12 [Fonsecaea nubica]OAL40567.1 Syntaxin pep12 [Fonsecaea nubica]
MASEQASSLQQALDVAVLNEDNRSPMSTYGCLDIYELAAVDSQANQKEEGQRVGQAQQDDRQIRARYRRWDVHPKEGAKLFTNSLVSPSKEGNRLWLCSLHDEDKTLAKCSPERTRYNRDNRWRTQARD